MELVITLNQGELRLEIRQKSRVIDFETAKYYHDLSDVLISIIDKLLKRTTLDLKAIKSYKIQGNLGTDSTSYKIASAFVEGLKVSR